MRLTRKKKDELLSAIRGILEALPDDHSCLTCSHYGHEAHEGFCFRWGEAVPTDARDAGCPEWTDDDVVPF